MGRSRPLRQEKCSAARTQVRLVLVRLVLVRLEVNGG